MAAEDPIRLRVRDDLHQAVGIVGRQRAPGGGEGEGAGLVGHAIRREFLLRAPDGRDFRVRVDDRRNAVVVDLRWLARDALGNHHALFRTLVRQHGPAHDIADGVDVRCFRHALVVDEDEAPLVEGDAAVVRQQVPGPRTPPDGHDQLVEDLGFLTVRTRVGDVHLAVLDRRVRHAARQADVEFLLAENLLRFLRDLRIHHREELVERFDQHHLGAESPPNASQLEADHAGADHAEALGNFRELECAGGVDDVFVIDRCGRNRDGLRARSDDDAARLDHARAAVRGRDLHVGAGEHLAAPLDHAHAVVLEQPADATGQLVHDFLLAFEHRRDVDGCRIDLDSVQRETVVRLVKLLARVEQCL